MKRHLMVALAAVVVMVTGCESAVQQPGWAPGLTPAARDTLTQWLLCEDCPPGVARDNASSLGPRAVGPLTEVLAGRREDWRENMKARYGRMARRIGRSNDSAKIVNDYLGEFDATIQRRAALVLGDIGSVEAIAALRDGLANAQARGYRADVVRTIQEALATAELPRFAGELSDSTPDFMDTVVVRRGSGLAWDGDETVVLNGGPFPTDIVVWRQADSIGFVAVADAGRYALFIQNLGPGEITQWRTLHLRAFPGTKQPQPLDLDAAALPQTIHRGFARNTTPRDTAHFIRVRTLADRTVTATVEWPGAARLVQTWEDCSARDVAGASRTIRGTVVSESGAGLGGATVRLVGTAMGSITTSSGQFSIVNLPPDWTGDLRADRIGHASVTRSAREGRAGYFIVLRPPGSPSPPPFGPVTSTGPSPSTTTVTIPAGGCALLGLTKSDAVTSTAIARLRLTSP